MSKSLKNFITIRQALEVYTSRQIRFCFLLHKYNEPMDYGDETMSHAVNIEHKFSEFFHNVKGVLRRTGPDSNQHVGAKEASLIGAVDTARSSIEEALCDDFDTPKAMVLLLDLIKETNRYIDLGNVEPTTLTAAARYITSLLRTFGVVPEQVEIGFPLEGESGGASKEQLLTPFLDALTKFREVVRLAAISGDTKAVLAAADELRDGILPDLGVRMEDKGSGKEVVTVWKLDDPAVLKKEKACREEMKAAKEKQKAENLKKQKDKEEKAKIPPENLFRGQSDLYSAFSSDGLPTHDKAGEPISKATLKRLQKEYAKQREIYEKFVADQGQSKAGGGGGNQDEKTDAK